MVPQLLALISLSAGAATVPDEYGSIQEAIDDAAPGATITVAPGDYTETVYVHQDVAIVGEGHAADTLLYPAGLPGIFEVEPGVSLMIQNLTLDGDQVGRGITLGTGAALTMMDSHCRNGSAEQGGCIHGGLESSVSVDRSLFEDSFAIEGGHIRIEDGGSLLVDRSWFLRGTAENQGGAISLGLADATLFRSQFQDNEALFGDGGAVASAGTLTSDRSWYFQNYAAQWGGAVMATGGYAHVFGGGFHQNSSNSDAGAVLVITADEAIFDRVWFGAHTSPGYGGAVALVQVPQVVFVDSWMQQSDGNIGGALYLESVGTVDIVGSSFVDNVAQERGAAFAHGFEAEFMRLENSFLCANASPEPAVWVADPLQFDMFGNTLLYHDFGGAVAQQSGELYAVQNQFLSSMGPVDGVALALPNSASGYSERNLFAWSDGGAAVFASNLAQVDSYEDWFYSNYAGNITGTYTQYPSPAGGDPLLQAYDPFNPDCVNVDVRPSPSSDIPLVGVGPWGAGSVPRWYQDFDGDGFPGIEDCNDWNDAVRPDTIWYADNDYDGHGDPGITTQQCLRPGSDWVLSDDDCDPGDPRYNLLVTAWLDGDGDGYGDPGAGSSFCGPVPSDHVLNSADCDDGDPGLNPGTIWYQDGDGDGYGDPAASLVQCVQPSGFVANALDCNDGDSGQNPDTVWYADTDGDNHGDAAVSLQQCQQPAGHVLDSTDCDDTNAAANPGLDEVCDGVDNDCDTVTDESDAVDAVDWAPDGDGDGYGDEDLLVTACDAPTGHVDQLGDCDDTNYDVNPGADEVCDGIDNNCDNTIDDDAVDQTTWYADGDGDGYGVTTDTIVQCEAPSGYVAADGDCDDSDPSLSPATTWYPDLDLDGYGDSAAGVSQCVGPTGYILDGQDCDDGDDTVNPEAIEVCDGVDNNCDGDNDIGAVDAAIWAPDADQDGFGDDNAAVAICEPPSDWTQTFGDCDDTNNQTYPGADEVCDGEDNDCDGAPDNNAVDELPWYPDADGDGWGDDSGAETYACTAPEGHGAAGDCDDADETISPDAAEVCDGIDNNCSGLVDDEDPEVDLTDATQWYPDEDGDGAGDAEADPVLACEAPDHHVSDASDCDDSDPELTDTCEPGDTAEPTDHNPPSSGKAGEAPPDGPSRYGVGCQHGTGGSLPGWALGFAALALLRRRRR